MLKTKLTTNSAELNVETRRGLAQPQETGKVEKGGLCPAAGEHQKLK